MISVNYILVKFKPIGFTSKTVHTYNLFFKSNISNFRVTVFLTIFCLHSVDLRIGHKLFFIPPTVHTYYGKTMFPGSGSTSKMDGKVLIAVAK